MDSRLSEQGFEKAQEWSWVTFVIDFASGELLFYRDGEEIGASPREELANTTLSDVLMRDLSLRAAGCGRCRGPGVPR
jgi:hypothetical protein